MRHTMADDAQRARDARSARADRRMARMRDRLAGAQTAEARLSTAFDWFRMSAGRLAARGTGHDGSRPNRPAAERIMREVADYLARAAADIDRGVRHDAQQ